VKSFCDLRMQNCADVKLVNILVAGEAVLCSGHHCVGCLDLWALFLYTFIRG
jgi:hypothetical protein